MKHDRTVKPVVCRDENHERPTLVCSEQASHPRFFREGQNLIFEDEINHDRTVKPVVYPQDGGLQRRFSRDSTNFKGETNHDRTEKPVVCRDISHAQGARKTSRSQEIETRSFNEEAVNHDGTETPAVGRDTSHEPRASHDKHVAVTLTSQEPPKHVPLMKAQPSTSETKQITIERRNPLFAVTQVTSQVTSNQC